ncbi:hypothetical protein CJF42_16130 [Pseudoalteromonas sp. NBT06-2]|uniref:hypothetical protein n=1 Tax=Pseudoalteromonas sp. NBT06-2 TaxID=2025950 RepID=UPI000BA52A7F|nr:hypothetical protein [Pseudoalteromonas sp. NBT06-2]PAJ73392.1 hypothetical protein CJF42_16130 [Pseudoalteromonas sp. NBT06-2]
MKKLPKDSPLVFCKAFINRELESNKCSGILSSYWEVMERIIERADELKSAFDELVSKFGYSDKQQNANLWMTLEHIWLSVDYNKEDVIKNRDDYREYVILQKEIIDLSFKLAKKLRRQTELSNYSGIEREDCQFVDDMIHQASEANYLYEHHLGPKMKSLGNKYDSKYWPSRAEVIEAIGNFERQHIEPTHTELPMTVIEGRATDIKDFVLAFDGQFDKHSNDLPEDFKFSNNAMADIINIILDFPPEKMTTPDAIRIVRNRYFSKIIVD